MNIILEFLTQYFTYIIQLFGILILIGYIIGFFNKQIFTMLQRSFGRSSIYLTAIIGTPIHELGHLFMSIIFMHKINSVELLKFDKNSTELGRVVHSYNKKNIYQRVGNFFIGIGPIIFGISVMVFLLKYMVPDSYTHFLYMIKYFHIKDINSYKYITIFLTKFFNNNNLDNIYFWIYIYIVISISSHITLSKADMKNTFDGFLVINIFIILIIIYEMYNNKIIIGNYIETYNSIIFIFMFFALIFIVLLYCIIYIINKLIN